MRFVKTRKRTESNKIKCCADSKSYKNKEVKDEDARRRQLDTHESIMDMTFKDLRNRVANTAEFDASLRQAYSGPSRPIQPHEHFTVSLVQEKVRRMQKRRRKHEREENMRMNDDICSKSTEPCPLLST